MPFALPAAASAVAAAAPAAAATAAKATLMTTLKSVAFNALTNLAISAALSVFQPQVGQAGRTFEFVIDPDGPIPFAAGRVGAPGSVIHRDTFGPDLMYYGIPFVLSGAGPITAFERFYADDELVTFDATGKAVTSQYAGEIWYRNRLGAQPDTALVSPTGLKNGATLPGWTSAHKLSGKACGLIVMGENSKGSAFPTGEVKPIVVLRGLKGWDPTQDSTYPGGSGPCRLNDPSTWVYLTCPILWALKWALGLWEGPVGKGAPQVDYQVGGIGAKLSGIDVPAFVAVSNVAKANGWTVAAYPNTDDDKHQVLQSFLQAGGAIYSQRAGKISCISRAAPRASIVTISAADTAGPLEIDTAASRIDRINTLRPRFWSEPHRWQMTALDGEVTAESYRTEDGAVRSRGVDFPYVSDAVQCGQLAALQIAHTREGIAGVIPLKPHLQRIRPGDAFTITEPGFVLNGLKCLCLNTDYDPATGVVRVSFVSETDGKYPFALGQSPTPPEPQVLTPVDPREVSPPFDIDWTITPRPPSGTGQLPTFDLSGVVSNDTATSILVEVYEVPAEDDPEDTPPVDTGWESVGVYPPTATAIPITVQPDRYYWIGIKYIRGSNYSDRTVWGPYLAGKLVADLDPEAVLNLPEFQDLQNQSRQTLEQLLKAANDRVTASLAEVEDRRAQVRDLLIRQGLIAETDPVSGAAILREDVLIQGQGGKTVAQTLELLYAADGLAEALIVAEQAARVAGDEAEASARLAAIAALQSSLSAAELTLRAYADAAVATGTAGLATTSALNAAITSVILSLQSYADASVASGTAGLATTSALASAQAAAAIDAQSRVDAYAAAAALNFVAIAAYNGLASTVGLQGTVISGLQTQNNLARLELFAAAAGGQPARLALVSDSLGSAIALLASHIYFGPNSQLDASTYTLRTTVGDKVRVIAWGAPFGSDGNLLEWWGPAATALGAMNAGNGYNGRMTTAPFAFDNTSADAFRATASTGFIGGVRSGAGPVNTSNTVTVTLTGGTSGATINWVRIDGDSRIQMNDRTAFTTGAYMTIGVGEVVSAYFMGVVTRDGQSTNVYVQVDFADTGT